MLKCCFKTDKSAVRILVDIRYTHNSFTSWKLPTWLVYFDSKIVKILFLFGVMMIWANVSFGISKVLLHVREISFCNFFLFISLLPWILLSCGLIEIRKRLTLSWAYFLVPYTPVIFPECNWTVTTIVVTLIR